ncbi:MAG: TRAP transporter small permease [Pararhizobium sp.]
MDGFIRFVRMISFACGVAAAALISAAVVVVCQMVFVRFVLGSTTIWQTDLTTIGLIAATLIGSPYVLLTRGHVNVDVLPLHLGPRARFRLALFSALVSFAFSLVMTWLGFRFWLEAWVNNFASDTIWRVRLWIPYAAMPFGFGTLALQYVVDIICLVTGREPPFGITDEPTGEAA